MKYLKVIILLSGLTLNHLWAQPFAGGTGTESDPFQISTAVQLESVRNFPASSFIMINDIDLDIAPYNTGEGWEPIGNESLAFSGNFYGAGHVIRNLYINRESTDDIGLFGNIGYATIDSLTIENGNVRGHMRVGILSGYATASTISHCSVLGDVTGYYHVGGVAGRTYSSTINACHATIDMSGTEFIGGIVGYNHDSSGVFDCFTNGSISEGKSAGGIVGSNSKFSTVINCQSTVDIFGGNSLGGLVGTNFWCSSIRNCNAKGSVSGNTYVGGLVGFNDSSSVSHCYATGNVSGSGNKIGGIAGTNYLYATIENCHATGEVSGAGDYIGGLVGSNYTHGYIRNCYSAGSVTGNIHIGGLTGNNYNGSGISNCYATGAISGLDDFVGGLAGSNSKSSSISACYVSGEVSGPGRHIGGVVGINEASEVIHAYFNADNTGQEKGIGYGTNDYPVVGLISSAMRQQDSFTGFNFDTVWSMRADSTLPALQSVNNAPYAFADTFYITDKSSGRATQELLENDCDYETVQEYLIVSIIEMDTGYLDNNLIFFNENSAIGDTMQVSYRVGELLNIQDTLWGNTAKCLLVLASPMNYVPVLSAVNTVYTFSDTPVTLSLSDVTASDADGDALSLIVFDGANYTHEGTTITPENGFTGTLTVPVAVTDYADTSNIMDISIVVENINGIGNSTNWNISLKPIPATNWIKLQGISSSTEVEIITMSGHKLLKQNISPDEAINITSLPKGVYYLFLREYGTSIRFIKQ